MEGEESGAVGVMGQVCKCRKMGRELMKARYCERTKERELWRIMEEGGD